MYPSERAMELKMLAPLLIIGFTVSFSILTRAKVRYPLLEAIFSASGSVVVPSGRCG
jgi:hypothetical protein